MNEQREAIAKTIHDAWNLSGVPYERANLFKASKFEAQADAVIAHLWREAMKPEVVEAVAKDSFEESWQGMLTWEEEQGSTDVPELIADAAKSLRVVLTVLLGPNPNEQETER